MKKYIIASILTVCFSSCTHMNVSTSKDVKNKYMVGAYSNNRELQAEDIKVFETTYSFGAKLKPQSVATQVVAGLNYSFICTNDSDKAVKIVIFKPLPNQGEAKISSIVPVTEYEDIISFVKRGYADKWQSISPEDIDVSYIYRYSSPSMGYAIMDINDDGIHELLLGDTPDEGHYEIYDVFTYDVNTGHVKHVASGGERDRYTLNGEGVLIRNSSNSAFDSSTKYYRLNGDTLEEIKENGINEDLKIIKLETFSKKD